MRKINRPSARALAWLQEERGYNNADLADWYSVSVSTVRRWKAEDRQAMEARANVPRTEIVKTPRQG